METALEYVRLAETGKTHIGKHDNWPEIRTHEENGLPWVTTNSQGPRNYADAVGGLYSVLYAIGLGEPRLNFSEEQNFIALVEYAKTQPQLMSYLGFDLHDFGPNHLQGMVACLAGFASLNLATNNFERAAQLCGCVENLLHRAGIPLLLADTVEYNRCVAQLREVLDEKTLSVAWSEGQIMTLEQAISYALSTTGSVELSVKTIAISAG